MNINSGLNIDSDKSDPSKSGPSKSGASDTKHSPAHPYLLLFGKAFAFVLVLGASMQLLFMSVHGYEKEYFATDLYCWVRAVKPQPKVLVMGSSTVYYGLSPRVLKDSLGLRDGEVINLAGPMRTSLLSYHIWSSLKHASDSVRVVLYGVDPWIFSEKYYQAENYTMLLWSPLQRAEIELDRQFPDYVREEAFRGVVFTRVLKQVRNNRGHIAMEVDTAPPDYGAEVLRFKPKNFWDKPAEYFKPYPFFSFATIFLERLRMLKQEVEAKGAEFVIVLPPKRHGWYAEYANDCAEVDHDFAKLLNQYLGPVKVIGSFQLPKSEKEQSLFMDDIHLGEQGQQYFSREVAGLVKNLHAIRASPVKPLAAY
ncbi:MAG: hypothetical protein ABI444_05640 [Candidatus Kapaibacterium sp.]